MILVVVYNLDGTAQAEFVVRRTAMNFEYYKDVLEHLRDDVDRKQPEKWVNILILHHGSGLCHTALW